MFASVKVFCLLQKVKKFGFSSLEDVCESWKTKDVSGHVTANMEVLCAQELPPSLAPVTPVTTRPVASASAASSGQAGVSESTGGSVINSAAHCIAVEGHSSTTTGNPIKGPTPVGLVSKKASTSTSTEGPVSTIEQTTQEGPTNKEGPRSIEVPASTDGSRLTGLISTEEPDRASAMDRAEMSCASGESIDALPQCQIPGCSRTADNTKTGTADDTGPSCTLHQHMPIYKPLSGKLEPL